MSRDDALKLADVMLTVADVNVISMNFSTHSNTAQDSLHHSQLHRPPDQHAAIVPRLSHHSLPIQTAQTDESVPAALWLQSAKRRYQSLWQGLGLASNAMSTDEASAVAPDNCASAVSNATVLHITAADQTATLLAKPGELHEDIWDQIVAPEMGCAGLLVESWLHSTSRLANTCCKDHCTVDAAGVRFGGNRWTVMQDHAKWGVCCDKAVVCFGDMNRVHSQRVRGGMTLCMAADRSVHSLPAQLYEHLLPAMRKHRTVCFWQRKEQCPCKRMQPASWGVRATTQSG